MVMLQKRFIADTKRFIADIENIQSALDYAMINPSTLMGDFFMLSYETTDLFIFCGLFEIL